MNWKQVYQDRYWEMLEILPPAAMIGLGFMVGEAYDHNAQGIPRFRAFVKIGEKYFEGRNMMTVSDFRRLKPEDVERAEADIDDIIRRLSQ